MHVQHGHAGLARRRVETGVGQQRVLHAGPAVALDPVASAGDHQQRACVGGAEARHVHRQRFTVAAQQRVRVRLHVQTCSFCRRQKLGAGFGVALGEEAFRGAGVAGVY